VEFEQRILARADCRASAVACLSHATRQLQALEPLVRPSIPVRADALIRRRPKR